MADNVTLNPGVGGAVAASDDISGVQFQRVKLTLGADGVNDGDVSDTNPLPVVGRNVVANASFTRPSDTTAYAAGDLVANSTTPGSVVPMTLTVARVSGGGGIIRRLRLHKSGTSLTNASFRVHLFTAAPSTINNGDNGAFSVSGVADYIGSTDITVSQAFTDGAFGDSGIANPEFNFKLASGTDIRALIEARAAYTPVSAEVFTLRAEVLQN